MAKAARRLRAGADERRGSAVHPLHLRLDRQAQGRACTPPPATCCTPRSRTSTSSTSTTTTSTGARPTSAGSPATATSSTARWQRRHQRHVRRRADLSRTRAASGRSSRSSRSRIFYTAPTAIRSLIRQGEEWPNKYDLSIAARARARSASRSTPKPGCGTTSTSARSSCPIVDTWWQTETGGILITPLPGAHTLKPGSASRPFFGVEPVVLRDDGTRVRRRTRAASSASRSRGRA